VQDYDETWPRADYCLNDDKQPFPLVPTAKGCAGAGPFGNRINHYKWFWWIYPYVKNDQVFRCPSRQIIERDDTGTQVGKYQDWYNSAELFNAYALNLSVTGALNTFGDENRNGAYRNSWTGGGLAGMNAPADTLLVAEQYFPGIGVYTVGGNQQTAYPLATREYWANVLKPNALGGKTDPRSAPHADGMNIVYADGHAKWLKADQFLSRCPTSAEYGDGGGYPKFAYPKQAVMAWTLGAPPAYFSDPNRKPWPLWGLQ